MTRLVVFSVALAFVVGFAFLTISAFAQQGVNAGSVISAFFVAILAIGIVGAFRHPPRR